MAERGDQGVEGELPVLIVIILVQFDFVQENNNDDDGDHGTSGVDSTHRVHLGVTEIATSKKTRRNTLTIVLTYCF